jgi:CRISPR-associated protein Csc1
MQIYRCELTLLEHLFFSSREVSDIYQTAPLVGNYALCYALGFCQAPYYNDGTIYYRQHLGALNEREVYVTPATVVGKPRFALRRFNAQTDTYWYAMGKNALVARPDGYDAVKDRGNWYLIERRTEKRTMVRATNRPQAGRLKLLALGTRLVFYLLAAEEADVRIPSYIRLGKFDSKARVVAEGVIYEEVEAKGVRVPFLLNPNDLPDPNRLRVFDLINIHPTPLVRNAVLDGAFYRLKDGAHLPAGMRFGV